MAEEINMKGLQMQGLTEKIENMLDALPKSKRKELDVAEIGQRLKEFRIALDAAMIELRQLGAHPEKAELKGKLHDHKNILKDLTKEYEEARAKTNKNELLEDEDDRKADMKTPDGLMNYALDVQDETTAAAKRALGVVEQTKEIGIDTVQKLESNTAQIEGVYDTLESIESSISRSTKIIKRVARKMASDKLMWLMILLIVGAIIAILVVKFKNNVKNVVNNITSST